MMEITNKTTEERGVGQALNDLFQALPGELQEAILEMDIRKKILDIGQKYNLSEENINSIENEVVKVLVTAITEEEFLNNIMDMVSLNDSGLKPMLEDIENEIFIPIEERVVGQRKGVLNSPLVISSLPKDLDERISEIGRKHNLHVDEVGYLKEEIDKVINGSSKTSEFKNGIKDKFGWNSQKTDGIAKDIDNNIFKETRMTLRERTSNKVTENENLDREQILKEIEEDEEIEAQNTPEVSSVEQDSNKDFLSKNIERRPDQNVIEERNENQKVAHKEEVFEKKLSPNLITNNGSRQEENKDNNQRSGVPVRKKYKGEVDPYREPIE